MANRKHIFIGLGGSGCQTVAQVKEKVYAKRFPTATATKTRLQAMNDDYRFLFIDTDSRDIEEANKRNRDTFEYGRVPFISPQTDLINLGRANPQSIYYEAQQDPETLINKRILEACSKELAVKIPDQPLAFGAGAFRMKSRIAFAHSLTDFQTKLQAAISALNDVKTVGGEDCTIFYWVVCSTLGGTGSGIFNDVLYHINQLHRQIVGDGDPQLVLTMYMPKVYIDSNATEEKYALNAFGVFTEVEAFKSMSYEPEQKTVMHRMAFANDYNLIDAERRYCPFYYMIPIDIQTDKGTSMGSTRVMYRNTAEMLYHLHYGQGGDTFRSDIDNYMNDIMEKNHKNFLVPMGYVSLQKPDEQFKDYMNTRFKRDLLRYWLLNEAENKEFKFEDSEVKALFNDLFKYCDPTKSASAANAMCKKLSEVVDNLNIDTDKNELPDVYRLGNVLSDVEDAIKAITDESKKERMDVHAQKLNESVWQAAEDMINKHGIVYTIKAIESIKAYGKELFDNYEDASKPQSREELKSACSTLESEVQEAEKEAVKIDFKEKLAKNNKDDIATYAGKLSEWIEAKKNLALSEWRFNLLALFCNDDKNDELSKLRAHLSRFYDMAKELNRDTLSVYSKLATKFGNTALDVTTVYLPMLKDICDGDGWKPDNFFSKLYKKIIDAQNDKDETPVRQYLCDFLHSHIYATTNEKMREKLEKGQYVVFIKTDDPKKKGAVIETPYTRFFTIANLERSPEKIITDFVTFAMESFEEEARNNKEIQDKWYTKKISSFFGDLTNDQKDEVRRSLNPALFFNYNNQRIDVVKKEEHIVFVASSEDLAHEMLGYEKGNPKHRFEAGMDENTALVLKSKFGLSLEDYRMYDSIKMVYDKASFREKYHFHHDFAQFRDRITLADLPDEVLEQHRTFAKMLILDTFKKEFAPLYYQDKYDKDSYADSMYIPEKGDFKIARPEALSIKEGKICLRKEDKGRKFYEEIEGATFAQQFAKYFNLYYNQRYGETLNKIIMDIQRSTVKIGDKLAVDVMKNEYESKRDGLLNELFQKRTESADMADQRLYNILFDLVRERYDTMHHFVGK